MIYIGASACLRGVVLSAAEYEGLDRFSMVLIEEKDILSGNMEELFIEGVTDILNKLDHKPTCVLPFTGCIHYFLATDIEYIYDELSTRFPDIDFISSQMTPTMKINDHTPEEDICRSMYLCIEEQPLNDKVVNFIGDSFPIDRSGDHMSCCMITVSVLMISLQSMITMSTRLWARVFSISTPFLSRSGPLNALRRGSVRRACTCRTLTTTMRLTVI